MSGFETREAYEIAYGQMWQALAKKEGHMPGWRPAGNHRNGFMPKADAKRPAKIHLLMQKLVEFLKDNPGLTSRQIRQAANLSRNDWKYIAHTGIARYNIRVVRGGTGRNEDATFYLGDD